jgi:hypothetical protein
MGRFLVAVLIGLAMLGTMIRGGAALGFWEVPNLGSAAIDESGAADGDFASEPEPGKTGTTSGSSTSDDDRRTKARKVDPHAPRERPVAADMAAARNAVLRSSDLSAGWKEVRASAKGGNGCPENDPDVSRFTVTGEAQSAFKGGQSRIESRVKLFANGGQAALFFEATSNQTILRCIRDGIKRTLRKAGLRPRVAYARFEEQPPVGARTAIYVVGYVLTLADGRTLDYPVDILTFQIGRAVGALSFSLVPSDDGLRPCSCELDHARVVASRVNRA